MFIIKHRNIFFVITGLVIIVSLFSALFFGLPLGADFTGGILVEVRYDAVRPDASLVTASLDTRITDYSLRDIGGNGYMLRAGNFTPENRAALQDMFSLNGAYGVTIAKLTEVGPTIGAELRNKAVVALILVLFAILLFIAFAFRKVSEPVSSWVYGLIALIALIHDVVVPIGFYAAFAHFFGAQVDTLFVTAALTILGFSIHDTIVVFDRIRENLRRNRESGRREDFEITAGKSIGQTFVRSVNTTVTVLIALLALFFFGPESIQNFSLTLIVGVVAGTYSSIALATPLLVAWEKYRKR